MGHLGRTQKSQAASEKKLKAYAFELEQKLEARTRELADRRPPSVRHDCRESRVRLCGSQFSFVTRFDGDLLHFAGCRGLSAEGLEAFRRVLPRPAGEDTAAGRAILHRSVAQIPDVQVDPAYGTLGVAETGTY